AHERQEVDIVSGDAQLHHDSIMSLEVAGEPPVSAQTDALTVRSGPPARRGPLGPVLEAR
ncbi:MAG TPA: hypothetical protein DEV93_13940, partial [Chloroflexi bacterium]|nr:hypothetical protein [Chloroflexota bacterium]